MAKEIIQLNIRKPAIRVVVLLFLLAACSVSYVALSWYAGNTLAENFASDERDIDVAKFGTTLTPKDPLAHWRFGQIFETGRPLDGLNDAIAEYEKAISLSPNDYRFWLALGMAHERAGDPVKGEQAMRKALSLAPSYAVPRWYLGNLLVRSGKYDEAFAELRSASEANAEFVPQLFNLIWAVYGADYDATSKALGNRADLRANFAFYLVNRQKFEEGLKVWSTLTATEKTDNKSSGDQLVAALIKAGRVYDAMNVWNDIAPTPSSRAVVDHIVDGSFEDVSNYGPENAFNWQVKNRQIQIDIDPAQGHKGGRSLRMVFQVRSQLDSIIATDLVPISPDTQYDFEFYVRSQELQSGATPLIQIITLTDNTVLAASPEAPNGDKDWQRVALSFKTPPKAEAVMVKITRGSCADTEVCPIFGTLWYDDFSFKRRN
jgi:Carbohydrate binding domain/Tetratricopeptide repeat